MEKFYEYCLRPILFRGDPELAHERALSLLALLSKPPLVNFLRLAGRLKPEKPIELWDLRFFGPIGLAAGFDKNGICYPALEALGFSHIELGTITAEAQAGNPRPRIHRLVQHEAIVNAMGFPNQGALAMAERLAQAPPRETRRAPLGINIGKSKVVAMEDAVDDYLKSYEQVAPYADYIAINISSPNTPELRELQKGPQLRELLEALRDANVQRAGKFNTKALPLLVKIAPELSFRELDRLLEVSLELGMDGIIATNTTTRTPELKASGLTGGLSGRPLHPKALNYIAYIHQATQGSLPIIGVGGILEADAASAMLDAGASLLQVYTGFIYKGPWFARELHKALRWHYRQWV